MSRRMHGRDQAGGEPLWQLFPATTFASFGQAAWLTLGISGQSGIALSVLSRFSPLAPSPTCSLPAVGAQPIDNTLSACLSPPP